MPRCFHWKQKIFGSNPRYNFPTINFFKKNSTQCSSGYLGGSFYEHFQLFIGIQFLRLKIQKQCLIYFFWKETLLFRMFLCTPGMEFWQRCQKWTKIQKSSAQTLRINVQTNIFLRIYPSLRKQLRTHRLHVWQPCR